MFLQAREPSFKLIFCKDLSGGTAGGARKIICHHVMINFKGNWLQPPKVPVK